MSGLRAGELAYYARTKGSYRPLRAAIGRQHASKQVAFLWGDAVHVIGLDAGTATVSGRGHHVEMPRDHLTTQPVLALWQIDCGQGDAALLRLPDGRYCMVDGGPKRPESNSGRNAIDFLLWKVFRDESWRREFRGAHPEPFALDALVCTHPDADHYGGFLDLVPRLDDAILRCRAVYHCGLGRFAGAASAYDGAAGFGQLGPVAGGRLPDAYATTLLDGFDDVRRLRAPARGRSWKLTGAYLTLLSALEAKGVATLRRVHAGTGCELARSVALQRPRAVYDGGGVRVRAPEIEATARSGRGPGARRALVRWLLGERLVYGLVNVRTDGRRVVIGTVNEGTGRYQTEEFLA